MTLPTSLPWLVLAGYCALIWWLAPRRVTASQFFGGKADNGAPPGLWLLVVSAAVTWIFPKSIANAGVNAIGVIGVPNSPRYVSDAKRKALFSAECP